MLEALRKSKMRKIFLPAWRLVRLWANIHSRGSLPAFLSRQLTKFNRQGEDSLALSVGAGGYLGELIRSECLGELVEIDIDEARAPDVVVDVCAMNCFAEGQFDAVFVMEVLEHVEDPRAALSEICRVLKPGGMLTISVPFILEIHDAPHDYWRFTEHGLRLLLREFDEVKIQRRTGYFTAGIIPLLRLYMSKFSTDAFLGLVFLLIAFISWPLILLGDLLIRSSGATSGYNVTCRKKK